MADFALILLLTVIGGIVFLLGMDAGYRKGEKDAEKRLNRAFKIMREERGCKEADNATKMAQ